MKYFITAILLLFVVNSASATSHDLNLGCFPREKVEKTLETGEFATLNRGTAPDGRLVEYWLNGKSQTIVLAYKKPTDGATKSITEVCVIMVTEETGYNVTTIDAMQKILKKDSPEL